MSTFDIIKKLSGVPAVSGKEGNMASELEKLMAPFVDECFTDNMGNLICKKNYPGAKENFLLTAHMDHIGFMVMEIDDKGRARLASLGGVNAVAYAYCTVVFESGIKGLLVPESGVSPADIRPEKLYVDFGAKSAKEVEKKLKVGDRGAVFSPVTRLLGKRITGSFQDNKIGCACLVLAAEKLSKKTSLPCNMVYAFTAQEEVGCRGSKVAAYNADPLYAVNVDIYPTGDTIGGKGTLSLGGGAAIKMKDASVICSQIMYDHLRKTASEQKIPYQIEVGLSGGTDTSSVLVSRRGVIAGALSVPTRFTHTQAEMIDLDDAENVVSLLCAAAEKEVSCK